MAGDFAVEDGGENREKGGEERCHLEELGLAGEVVGVGVLAEALVEVGEEAGLALVGEWDTGIHMLAGIEGRLLIWDMVIPTMGGPMFHFIDTHMDIRRTEISNVKGHGDSVGLIGILGGTNMKKW